MMTSPPQAVPGSYMSGSMPRMMDRASSSECATRSPRRTSSGLKGSGAGLMGLWLVSDVASTIPLGSTGGGFRFFGTVVGFDD